MFIKLGCGVAVGSGVNVGGTGVEVGVGVTEGVIVGDGVNVGDDVGVNVGPNNCPAIQLESKKLIIDKRQVIAKIEVCFLLIWPSRAITGAPGNCLWRVLAI